MLLMRLAPLQVVLTILRDDEQHAWLLLESRNKCRGFMGV